MRFEWAICTAVWFSFMLTLAVADWWKFFCDVPMALNVRMRIALLRDSTNCSKRREHTKNLLTQRRDWGSTADSTNSIVLAQVKQRLQCTDRQDRRGQRELWGYRMKFWPVYNAPTDRPIELFAWLQRETREHLKSYSRSRRSCHCSSKNGLCGKTGRVRPTGPTWIPPTVTQS